MPVTSSIQLLRREEVDTAKWDACLAKSSNGLIYGYHYYLDVMADNWHALVRGDYEAVMPLPWRRKWGFRYLYQPAFCQQGGVFSTASTGDTGLFLEQAALAFPFAEIHLNAETAGSGGRQRNNFILDLSVSYAHRYKQYKNDLLQNLKKAGRYELRYSPSGNFGEVCRLYRDLYAHRLRLDRHDWIKLLSLCKVLDAKQQLIVRQVIHGGQSVCSCVLLNDGRRLYLLVSATTEAGRKMAANHFLLDQVISEFQQQPLWLDFEGSDLPGIAHFYGNFGAVNRPYFFCGWNRLPFPFRLLKPAYRS